MAPRIKQLLTLELIPTSKARRRSIGYLNSWSRLPQVALRFEIVGAAIGAFVWPTVDSHIAHLL